MKEYEVRVTYTVYDYYTVEADSEEEARDLAKELADQDSLNDFQVQDCETEIQ